MHRHLPLFRIAAFLILIAVNHSSLSAKTIAEGWLFRKGDLDSPAQTLEASSFAGEPVRVPHDWAASGPFDPEAHGGTGKLPWQGVGWYRYELELPASPNGTRAYLDFDGAMAFPTVFLNGEEVGSWDYGYTPFRIDLTEQAKFGQTNIVAVRIDTREWSSRWYPGAGLYRKVNLTIENPIHFAHWGLGITTDGDELQSIPAENASLSVQIENHLSQDSNVTIEASIFAPSGNQVSTTSLLTKTVAGATTHRKLTLHVDSPELWDVASPNLYTARVRILDDSGNELDALTESFGFRTFAFTDDDGFHLNGRRIQLHGVNLHHDLGPLGAAFNKSAARRQLEIMMEMGVNAIRTSHNPPAKEFLELCDELGLVVWDEVFDKWAWTAGRDNHEPPLAPFAFHQIRNTILRDRNHPSVVTWSVGNEVNPGDDSEGITPERVAMMSGLARTFDDTRPISIANHIPPITDGKNFESLDLVGWNYARRYARFRNVYPDIPIIYSESASAVSTRGYYDPELATRPADYGDDYQISSYDLNAAFWSDIADAEFELMKNDSYVAGEFVWTGFDYIGEPTPHDADSRSAYFGIVDLCGFPKDRFYLYRSHWRENVDTVHILPHWNWKGREGKNVPVFVYTNGDSAELFLNGKSLGIRRKGERPTRSPNLAPTATASASSGENAASAIDDNLWSAWTPDSTDSTPSWTLDLGKKSPVKTIQLETQNKEHLYAYTIEASANAKSWKTIVDKPTSDLFSWQGTNRILHSVDTNTRFLRLTFTKIAENTQAGLKDFRVFAEPTTNDYYDITYDYRLRWDQVAYEPGELIAVAYKDGKEIGTTSVETTGDPVSIRLIPDRTQVAANGEDLAFITVEALDASGRPCPLADNAITFSVSGAGSFEATGNGDQRSFVAFSSPTRKLFYGKALLIVRPTNGKSGSIAIEATASGLKSAHLEIETRQISPP